jgi:L-aspartate oxidase
MTRDFDAIVVGGGLAGMLTALELAPRRVVLVSHAALGESTSSAWAQGGIAAAVGHDDSPALHASDTEAAGAGIVERRIAARLAADAPRAIERIAARGVRFDREGDATFALGREGAHSRRRILRAGGDATGAELVRAIVAAVHASRSIVLFEHARARDVLLAPDGTAGGVAVVLGNGDTCALTAPNVVLATGGLGGLYRFTTNPTASRGAGIALAARAGARLADLEFVQFHPTALDVASDPLPLVTEALRGEGAILVDAGGARVMTGIDGLELAPRDVVARRVFALRRAGERTYLDARGVADGAFRPCSRRACASGSIRATRRSRSFPRPTITWAASPSTSPGARACPVSTRAAKRPPRACTARTGSRAIRSSKRSCIPSASRARSPKRPRLPERRRVASRGRGACERRLRCLRRRSNGPHCGRRCMPASVSSATSTD